MSFCFAWAVESDMELGEDGVVGVDVTGIFGSVLVRCRTGSR